MQGPITLYRDRKRTALSAFPTTGARMKSFTPGGSFTAVRSGAVSAKEGKEWKNRRSFD